MLYYSNMHINHNGYYRRVKALEKEVFEKQQLSAEKGEELGRGRAREEGHWRAKGESQKGSAQKVTFNREFKDVVFEDVVFDNNSFVTLLDIVCYCNIYAKAIIIKHHILKHRILELPI